jgi:hypothetical protein
VRLTDSNIVLLGGFNPNIIEPAWLSRHDVVEKKPEEVMTEIQFGPGAPQMMRFNLDGLRWEVSLDRILIGSGEARSPAKWILRLLELLPHTPLRAVGINFKLRSDRADWPLEIPKLPNQEGAASLIGEVVASTAVTRGRLDSVTQLNLTLNATESEVVLDANFHRGVVNTETQSALEMAKQAMSEFDGDWARLCSIVSEMTGKEVG